MATRTRSEPADPFETEAPAPVAPAAPPVQLSDRLPPHSVEAEQYTLGAVLISKSANERVWDRLVPGDFFMAAHRAIAEACLHLWGQKVLPDVGTVPEELRRRGQLEAIGGALYVDQLANGVPTAANVEYYAQIVVEKSALRQIVEASETNIRQAREEEAPVPEIIDACQRRVLAVEARRNANWVTAPELVDRTVDRLNSDTEDTGAIFLQLRPLDRLLRGLKRRHFVVLAGRPGMGKSSLMTSVTPPIARAGHPVGIVSLEMTDEQIQTWMLAAQTGIDSDRLFARDWYDGEWARVGPAGDRLRVLPYYVADKSGLGVGEIVTLLRRWRKECGIELAFIDHLQHINLGKRRENTHQALTEVCMALKDAAKELDICIVALSQLSRNVERRDDKRPQLSDLRESGSIEAEADVVIGLYRQAYYDRMRCKEDGKPYEQAPVDEVEALVLKNRAGKVGVAKIGFMPAVSLFVDLDERHEEDRRNGSDCN